MIGEERFVEWEAGLNQEAVRQAHALNCAEGGAEGAGLERPHPPSLCATIRAASSSVKTSRIDVDYGRLGGFFILFFADEGAAGAFDDGAVDGDFRDVFAGGEFVHQVEHGALEEGAEGAGAGAFFDRFLGEGAEGIFCEGEGDSFHGKEFGVLLGQCVLSRGENFDQFVFGQFLEDCADGESSDEFRDHAEAEEVFGFNKLKVFTLGLMSGGVGEAHGFSSATTLDDLVEAYEGSATNEEDSFGIDLNVFLMGMLPSALWRDVAN